MNSGASLFLCLPEERSDDEYKYMQARKYQELIPPNVGNGPGHAHVDDAGNEVDIIPEEYPPDSDHQTHHNSNKSSNILGWIKTH